MGNINPNKIGWIKEAINKTSLKSLQEVYQSLKEKLVELKEKPEENKELIEETKKDIAEIEDWLREPRYLD